MKKVIAALLLVPVLAFAQTGATGDASRIKKPKAAAPAAAPAVVTEWTPFTPITPEAAPGPNACVSPGFSRAFSKQSEADQFNDALTNYQACMKDYVDAHTKASNQHADAANKAVAEANAYITELNSTATKPK